MSHKSSLSKKEEILAKEEAYIEKMMVRDAYYERRDNTLPRQPEVVETWHGPVTVYGPLTSRPRGSW